MSDESLQERIRDEMPRALDELSALAAVPSIAFPGFADAPLLEGAGLTREILEGAGYEGLEILDLPGGHPSVLGELRAEDADAPTVLLYAHYDVQPWGDADDWETPAFEPVVRDDGRLYGRGTADDKSGITIHAAVARVFGGRPPVHLKIVVEGEEETGVSALGQHIRSAPSRFAADAIVICDVGNPVSGSPTLTTSLRGITSVLLEVRTLEGEKHSGLVGGAAPDALIAMAKVIATLQDDQGNCAIPGLVHGTWDGADVGEEAYRAMAGLLPEVERTGGGSIADHLFARPSVNVLGLDAPPVHGARNILIDVARAKISVRIPPGQDAQDAQAALIKHLGDVAPWGAQITITPLEAVPGFAVPIGGPVHAVAKAALAQAYGAPTGLAGCGMTIPLVHDLAAALPEAELLLWGTEEPRSMIHAPNESVDPAELERVALGETLFLSDLAAS